MRVLPSFPYIGVGMTLLTALGFALPAQQARKNQLDRPVRQVGENSDQPLRTVVRPTRFEWSELRRIQESLPQQMDWNFEPRSTQVRSEDMLGETEDLVLPTPEGLRHDSNHVLPATGDQGGVERLAPCASFPANPPAGSTDWSSVTDTTGAPYPGNAAGSVGPNHLMSMTASDTLIQDRTGGTLSTVSTPTFWSPLLPASVSNCRVHYLGIVGHWVAVARGGSGAGTTTIMWAVSDSDDPMGTWTYYSIDADPGFTTFADGLFMGYNSTWVAVTADMYANLTTTGNSGSRLYTIDLQEAIDGDLDPVTFNTFASSYWPGPFATTTNYRCVTTRALDNSIADLWVLNSRTAFGGGENGWAACRLTGTGAAPSFVVTPSPLGSALFFPSLLYSNGRQTVLQALDVRSIDPHQVDGINISTRCRMQDAVVRNGHIFVTLRNGGAGPQAAAATRNAIRFAELDPTLPFFIDGGTGVGPFVQDMQIDEGANTTLMYPSLAVNCANDVLVGFSRGNSGINPEAAYCMRLGTDAPNTMGAVTTLKLGDDAWWQAMPAPGSITLGAWGFYSSSAIDPNDDKTLWTLQQYAATRAASPGVDADSRWGTWWGRLGDCEIRPVITDHPDSVTGCVGDLVSFSVTATTGSNPLTYQWRLNGNDILGATSDTYMLSPAIGTDEGTYEVVVCGCGQEISLPATLEFDEPTINTQPDDYTAGLGDPAAFFVVATPSLGGLSYQWFHGANPVGIDDDILIIPSVVGGDYGPYHCVVSDACGPIATSTALLKPPPVFNKTKPAPHTDIVVTPSSQLGCVDDSVAFGILDAPAGSTYEWFKGNTSLGVTTRDLVLSSLDVTDAGTYYVHVDIGTEVLVSSGGSLTMGDNPVIVDQPDDENASAGATVIFSVTASGAGPLHYQWKYSSNSGTNNFFDIPGANNPTFTLFDVPASAAGRYRCAVSNPCGTTLTRIARLIIL